MAESKLPNPNAPIPASQEFDQEAIIVNPTADKPFITKEEALEAITLFAERIRIHERYKRIGQESQKKHL